MSPEDYKLAWIAYAAGSLIIMLGWWQVTKSFKHRYVRNGLRIIALVLLFTPHSSEPGQTLMAPALFVTALEPFFIEAGDPMRAGSLLLKALGLALVLYLLIDMSLFKRRRRAKAAEQLEADREELLGASRAQEQKQEPS